MVRPAVEALGGTLDSFHLSWGEYDVTAIRSSPATSMRARLASAAQLEAWSGPTKRRWFEPEEGIEAMRRAGAGAGAGAGAYRPPS
jgi:hypothetical protein